MKPKGWKKTLTFAGCSALGAAIIASAVAQDTDNKKQNDSPFDAFAERLEGGLKKLLAAIPADENERKEIDKAFEQFQKAFDEPLPGGNAQKGPQGFRYEWKSGDAEEIQELLKKLMGEDGLNKLGDFNFPFGDPGQGGNGFHFDFGGDMGKQLDEMMRAFGQGGGLGDIQKQMEELFGDLGGQGGGARLFDMSDMADMWAPNENGKDHADALKEYDEVVSAARQSTVRILDGKRQVALGTILSHDGHALTKASEVGEGTLTVELANGEKVDAEVLDTMADYDLALIKINASNLTPAKFVDSKLGVGTFLAAASTTESPVAVGAVSVAERNLSEKEKGFLGIAMVSKDNVVVVSQVTPNSAAKRAGVEAGDVVLKVDGLEIHSPRQLSQVISGKSPADTVNLHIDRKGEAVDINATLMSRAQMPKRFFSGMDMSAAMGGRLSKQREGYPLAVQHDLTLQPNECGSPLVDLDGNVVGINIARAGRVKSYAIPAKVIIEMMEGLDTPAPRFDKDAAALKREADEAERLLQEARDALKSAEERARRATDSLNQAE